MPRSRPLPPQFLLPSWNLRQLRRAFIHNNASFSQWAIPPRHGQAPKTSAWGASTVFRPGTPTGDALLAKQLAEEEDPNAKTSEANTIRGGNVADKPGHGDKDRIKGKILHVPSGGARRERSPAKRHVSPAEKRMQRTNAAATLSLFEELFPEERRSKDTDFSKKSNPPDEFPTFSWSGKNRKPSGFESWRRSPDSERDKVQEPTVTRREAREQAGYVSSETAEEAERLKRKNASVLILHSTMKTLEESDFFRLGPKGEHIEGWTSGIMKVIPGRDNRTLRPLSHYFILFHSAAAAKAYLDNIFRIWRIARMSSAWESSGVPGMPLPPGLLRADEERATIAKNFTLTSVYNKLFLRMVNRPYRPAMEKMLMDGGARAIAQRKTKAENMVLVSSDYRSIQRAQLFEAIKQDGKRRNLHWRLDGNSEEAIVRLDESEIEGEAEEGDETSAVKSEKGAKGYSRYVLSFRDRHEARRFVREWHKRPLPLKKSLRPGEEQLPVINAEILW